MNGDLNYIYNIAVYSNGISSNFFFLFSIYFIIILGLTTPRSYPINCSSTLILEKDNFNNCLALFETYDWYFFSDISIFLLW